MRDIEDFILPHLANLATFDPAVPIEQMAEKAGMPVKDIVRLNANENPYGASPKVVEALSKLKTHLYPDPLQRQIRGAISNYTTIDSSHVVAGAGSDELIDLLFRLIMSPGDQVIDCDPTFGMYSFCARIAGAHIISVPRDSHFEIDVEAIIDAITPKTKMAIINSPNNPTGNIASLEQVISLLHTKLIVIVDEAYFEFCGQTVAPLVSKYQNLVVLRTFSKWAGIAGLRVGYGLMSPSLVERIISMKSPYNINSAAEVAALASLEDTQLLMDRVEKIVLERERLFSFLEKMPGIRPLPSGGNYILCQLSSGKVNELFDRLAERGVFLRKFTHKRMTDYFRISVGLKGQNDTVLNALAELI